MFGGYDHKHVTVTYQDGRPNDYGFCITQDDGTADIHESQQDGSDLMLTIYTAGDEIYAMGKQGEVAVVDSFRVYSPEQKYPYLERLRNAFPGAKSCTEQ